jgi:serine/threonine-protein kinase
VCHDCPELLAEVRQRWQAFRRIDAEVEVLIPEPGSLPAGDADRPGPPPAGLPQVPGYEVEAVLGQGGMGVVYKARHLALKRTVALKMLAGGNALPADRARFKTEAEAVARLQHPNIIQIHEVGEAGGVPFFALEFVEGGSLARRLAGRVLPPRDAAHLVGALAEAMHLAHSRNLVHRDLKPANVLLGGEADTPIDQCQPKVTDFGLARQLDVDSGQTQEGVVMGTPSYMAPEQAEGRAHAAGPAADVYALGAVLYECLTGRPPFKGETLLETLQQVRGQEPAAPSALNQQVPRDLDTICLKCLRKPPEQRYSSARELADDLGRFVRGEPVAARPVGVAERLRKWVWRRPAAAGLLAALVLLVAAGGVGAWLHSQQQAAARARQAQTDQEALRVLEEARGLLDEGWQAADLAKLTKAEAEANRAEGIARSGGASAAAQQEVEALRKAAAGRLARAEKNHAVLEAVLDVSAPRETDAFIHGEAGRIMVLAQPSLDEQYASAFRRWGLDVDGTPEAEVVERLRQEPDVVVRELIAGLDAWMMERRSRGRPEAAWRRLFRVAEQLDRSERHRQLRMLLVGGSPPRAESVAGLLGMGSPWAALWELARGEQWRQLQAMRREFRPASEPVVTVVLFAQACAAVGDTAGAEQVLRKAATVRPDQVVLLDALGKLLERQGPGRLGQAIEYYRAARGQRPSLGISLTEALLDAGRAAEAEEVLQELAPQHRDSHVFQVCLGIAAYDQTKYGEAEAAFRKAIDVEPARAAAHYDLGNALLARQAYGEAGEALRKAIDLKPDFARAYCSLGRALVGQGKLAEADAPLRKAIALKPDMVEAYSNLGIALVRRQKYSDAEAALRKAIDIKPDHPLVYSNLGHALVNQGKHGEAEAAYRKAIDLTPGVPLAHYNLGVALLGWQRYGEAEAAFRRAIDLKPDDAEAQNNLSYALAMQTKYAEAEAAARKAIDLKPDLPQAHLSLGNALAGRQRYGEAEAAHRKAIDLKPDYAKAHNGLGTALMGLQRFKEAEAAFRKAIDLKFDFAQAYSNLGFALVSQGKHDQAEAACRKAIDLKPDLAEAHNSLGNALLGRQKYAGAEAAYRKAIDLRSDFALAYYNLGNALVGQRRHSDAEAPFRKAIDLKPDYAEAYNNLGHVLGVERKYALAEAACRKAINLRPDLPQAHYNLGGALVGLQRYVDAEAAYRRAIELRPKFAQAYSGLGIALGMQRKYPQAEAAYREAIDFQPDLPQAHYNLGRVLWQQAQFDKAATSLQKATDLLPAKDPLRDKARQLQQQCQRYVILDARLPAILRGTEKPSGPTEQIEIAELCNLKKHYGAAACFYRDAFSAEPKLAEVVLPSHRYTAACAAAVAACGQGKDADKLNDKERALWRRQALEWLRQDLTRWGKALESGNAQSNAEVRQRMRDWQADYDLAGVRAKDALARLPDEERQQWEKFWSDVDALLRRAREPE